MTTYQYTLSLHDALPICFDLKKLMEDKFNELKDLRGQLEGKIKDKARDTLREKVEGTAGEGLLAAIERLEKEHARLKMLYEKCIIEVSRNPKYVIKILEGSFEDQEKKKILESKLTMDE